jgi:hypothetical protein
MHEGIDKTHFYHSEPRARIHFNCVQLYPICLLPCAARKSYVSHVVCVKQSK